jgi:hypothetical protein
MRTFQDDPFPISTIDTRLTFVIRTGAPASIDTYPRTFLAPFVLQISILWISYSIFRQSIVAAL